MDDLEMIAMAMHSWNYRAAIDPVTHEVRVGTEDGWLDGEEPGADWYGVPQATSGEDWSDIAAFVELLPEGEARHRLHAAMSGPGAFRRFRNAVHSDPSEVGRHWSRFRDARRALRAIEWLRDEEIITADEEAALRERPIAEQDAVAKALTAAG